MSKKRKTKLKEEMVDFLVETAVELKEETLDVPGTDNTAFTIKLNKENFIEIVVAER